MGIQLSHSAEQKLEFVGISLDSCNEMGAVCNLDGPTDSQSEHR